MPMITLPMIPTLAALGVFISMAFEESDMPVVTAIACFIASVITYFAIYGLMAAVGL